MLALLTAMSPCSRPRGQSLLRRMGGKIGRYVLTGVCLVVAIASLVARFRRGEVEGGRGALDRFLADYPAQTEPEVGGGLSASVPDRFVAVYAELAAELDVELVRPWFAPELAEGRIVLVSRLPHDVAFVRRTISVRPAELRFDPAAVTEEWCTTQGRLIATELDWTIRGTHVVPLAGGTSCRVEAGESFDLRIEWLVLTPTVQAFVTCVINEAAPLVAACEEVARSVAAAGGGP